MPKLNMAEWLGLSPTAAMLFMVIGAATATAGTTRGELSNSIGKTVWIVGRVSPHPDQHMIRADTRQPAEYIDLREGGQIVAYVQSKITCRQPVLLEGKVLLTGGSSKRPGSKEHAAELQLDVARWTCLDQQGLTALINRLVRPDLSRGAKEGTETGIVSGGKAAIPLLIRHLSDQRTCWTERALLNEGELYNRSALSPPVKEKWATKKVTLRSRCAGMLTRIITPAGYRSPYAAVIKPSLIRAAPFRVRSWPAWWARHQTKSLEQIHEEMKLVLDAYWKANGVQQLVQ